MMLIPRENLFNSSSVMCSVDAFYAFYIYYVIQSTQQPYIITEVWRNYVVGSGPYS